MRNAHIRKIQSESKARIRKRRHAAGLCVECGINKTAIRHCEACLKRKCEYYANLKAKAKELCLAHYGCHCMCPGCTVTIPEFLSVEHLEGGGIKHRKENKIGNMWLWLVHHNYPEGFAVWCFNCNLAKGFFGACPHSKETQ